MKNTCRYAAALLLWVAVCLVPCLAAAGEAVSKPESLQQPLPPIVLREFTSAFPPTRPSREEFPVIDRGLDRARQISVKHYGWLHSYLYAAGVHAAGADDYDRSRLLLKEYLSSAGHALATAAVPSDILSSEVFRDARNAVINYREQLMKQWGDQRWSLHNYKADQVGFEYESAIALRVLLTDPAGIAKIVESLSASPADAGPGTCLALTADNTLLWCALRLRQTGNEAMAVVLLDRLASSDSRHPVDFGLLHKLQNPPPMVMGFRRRAVATLAALLLAAMAMIAWLRHRRQKADPVAPEERPLPAYAIDRSDPMSWLTVGWLGLSPIWAFLLGLMLLGGGLAVLAWSEDALWPSGHVVDRAFLDYLSFPYGFGLLIPAFLAGTRFLYRLIQTRLPDVLGQCFPAQDDPGQVHGQVLALWRRRARICNAPLLTVGCLAASIVITLGQKWQWALDPGTAFVDLHYPGHWSLTGIYFTAVALLVYYYVISYVFRGVVVLSFFARVYSRKWRQSTGVLLNFDAGHPDNCNGVQPLGWVLLLYYVLLLLLAAQVLLNLVEKLRFYESVDVVLQHTFVSVVGFGAAFFLVVPIIVGKPIAAIHLAMREVRRREGLRLSALTEKHKQRMLQKIDNGLDFEQESQAYNAMKALKLEIGKMPLWPFDLKVAFYFVVSHAVPLFSFLLPILEKRLGLSF